MVNEARIKMICVWNVLLKNWIGIAALAGIPITFLCLGCIHPLVQYKVCSIVGINVSYIVLAIALVSLAIGVSAYFIGRKKLKHFEYEAV